MRPLESNMKHTVFLQNANAVTEWEISGLTRKEAETEAFEAARNTNDGEMVFIVCANGYLNQDGYNPVGNAWIAPKISKLEMAGHALYGQTWQTQLGNALGTDSRRIRQWLANERPIPVGVWADITLLAEQRRTEIDELITKL